MSFPGGCPLLAQRRGSKLAHVLVTPCARAPLGLLDRGTGSLWCKRAKKETSVLAKSHTFSHSPLYISLISSVAHIYSVQVLGS
jgi:hypothetical protein